MLGDMFDYVETKEEMTCSLNHFHTYDKKIKDSLKSDYIIQAISVKINNTNKRAMKKHKFVDEK